MSDEQTRGRYPEALRAHWIYVVVAVVVSVGVAVIVTHLVTPRYEAGADVLVDPVPSGTLVGLPVLREQASGSSVVTAARLANSPQVAERARTALGLAEAPKITVTPQQQSNIVTITGSSSTAAEAAKIANAFASALIADRTASYRQALRSITNDLSRRLKALPRGSAEATAVATQLAAFAGLTTDRDPTLQIVSPAVPPTSAASPRPVLNVIVALLVGLLLGIGVVVALEIARPHARPDTLAEGGPSVLARMPRPINESVRAAVSDPTEMPVDMRVAMRTLWTKLRTPRRGEAQARVVLVTGAGTDGTTAAPAVAASLAAIISRAGTSVVLLDADLEHAPLASMVEDDDQSVTSIGQLMASDGDHVLATDSSAPSRLHALLVRPEDRFSEWLSPYRLPALVADVRGQFDSVVISAPPPPTTETMFLVDVADAIVVAVDPGATPRDEVVQLLDVLEEQGATPVGFVVLDPPSLMARVADASSSLKTAAAPAADPAPPEAEPQRRWA